MLNTKLKNRGFTILELLIVLSTIAFIMSLQLDNSNRSSVTLQAKSLSSNMTQYNNAVKSFLSHNMGNETLYTNAVTTFTGVDWLKDSSACSDGLGDMELLPCDYEQKIGNTDLEYTTTIYANSTNNKLRSSTFVDFKDASGNTVIDESALGLVALNANGGNIRNAQEINASETETQMDAFGTTYSNIIINGLDTMFYYCPTNINIANLSPECRKLETGQREGGLIVIVSDTSKGSESSYLMANGGNSMHRSFRFDGSPTERGMAGVDRMYNIAGQILKIGNSGIYQDGDWTPTLGDGLVIDTDIYAARSINTKDTVTSEFDILTKGNLVSENTILSKSGIIVEGSQSVKGDLIVVNESKYNGDFEAFGLVNSLNISVDSFASANEVVALNTISAGVIINAPQITASSALVSSNDLNVAQDSVINGSTFTEGNTATEGDIHTGSIQFENGDSYLKDIYMSALYSNSGSYILDPSGVTTASIVKADKISPANSGSKMDIKGNSILLTREEESCGNSASCATNIEGYIDTSRLYIKSPKNGAWVGLTGYLVSLESEARN